MQSRNYTVLKVVSLPFTVYKSHMYKTRLGLDKMLTVNGINKTKKKTTCKNSKIVRITSVPRFSFILFIPYLFHLYWSVSKSSSECCDQLIPVPISVLSLSTGAELFSTKTQKQISHQKTICRMNQKIKFKICPFTYFCPYTRKPFWFRALEMREIIQVYEPFRFHALKMREIF